MTQQWVIIMSSPIGINGVSRASKLLLRTLLQKETINIFKLSFVLIHWLEEAKVVAINDPQMSCEEIVHFLRYDSDYGQFMEQIEVKFWKVLWNYNFFKKIFENKLIIGNNLITVFNEEINGKIPWSKVKVQLVAECSDTIKIEVSYSS